MRFGGGSFGFPLPNKRFILVQFVFVRFPNFFDTKNESQNKSLRNHPFDFSKAKILIFGHFV